MASRYLTHVAFTGIKPTPVEVKRLNKALKAIDYDAPDVTESGIELYPWRSPSQKLEELLAFFVRMGFDCCGYRCLDVDEQDFYSSSMVVGSNTIELPEWEAKIWEEAYWEGISLEEKQLDFKLKSYQKTVKLLDETKNKLQQIEIEDKLNQQKTQDALTIISEVIDNYSMKIKEISNGKVD